MGKFVLGGADEVEAPRAGGKGGAGKAPGVTVADLTVEMGTGGPHIRSWG